MSVNDGSAFSLFKKAALGVDKGLNDKMKKEADFFLDHYKSKDDQVEDRKENAPKMVEVFYDLVTDFYESGWGQSFHFAPRGRNETFRQSMTRHEHYIASKIQLNEGENCLDAGCGIGGPMRNICQFTHSKITGITINDYQVKRGNLLNQSAGLSHLCELQQMNFLEMKFPDNTFDKCFSIEATCHAGNREDVFKEILRVLKPGALFASYEWVLTDKYNPENPEHVRGRQLIEEGNALPELVHDKEVVRALKASGFEVVEATDLAVLSAKNGQLPWYGSLQASCSIENFHHSYIATCMTHGLCWSMEKLGLAPKGTLKTHEFLLRARDGCVIGGVQEFFSPMFLIVGRKPLK